MIISYPDEVTHRAIIKTIKQLLDELVPTGIVNFPPLGIYREGKELTVACMESSMDEGMWNACLKGRDMKALIEENMEF